MGPKKKNKGKSRPPPRQAQSSADTNKRKFYKEEFQEKIGDETDAVQAVDFYWNLLCGRKKQDFIYVEDVVNHPEKRPRIMKICKEHIFEREDERSEWLAAYECLKLFVDGETHECAFTLLDSFSQEDDVQDNRSLVEIHYRPLHERVFGGTIEFFWLELVLRRALIHESDQWLSIWSLEQCVSLCAGIECGLEGGRSFTKDFFINEIIPRLDKTDLFWRLIKEERMAMFCKHIEEAINLQINSTRDTQLLLKYIRIYTCANVVFNSVYALRSFPKKQLLSGSEDMELMKELVVACRDFRYPMMKVFTIETLVMFSAKVFELNGEVIGMLADFISIISPHVKEEYVERIYHDLKTILYASEDFRNLSLERRTKGIVKWLDFPSYTERARLFWMVAAMNNDQLKQELDRVHAQILKAIASAPDDVFTGLPPLFALYANRPITKPNALKENPISTMKMVLKNCFLENRGYLNEVCAARTIVRDIFIRYTPRETVMSLITELFKMMPQKQIQCQPVYMVFLEALIETQIFPIAEWLEIKELFDEYLGATMLDKFKRPMIIKSWPLSDLQLAELGNIFHEIRICLYLKIRPTITDWAEAATACLSVIKFPTTEFRAKERLLRLMFFLIAKHPKPMICLEECAKVVDGETSHMLAAWKEFVHLPLVVLKIVTEEAHRKQCVQYLLDAIHRGVGIANWDARVATIILDEVERELLRNEKPDDYLSAVVIQLATFFPGDNIMLGGESLELKEYGCMLFNYYKMLEDKVLKDGDGMERIQVEVLRTRFRAILLCIRMSEHKGWTDLLAQLLFKFIKSTKIPAPARRACQLLLILSDLLPPSTQIIDECVDLLRNVHLEYFGRICLEWFLGRLCLRSRVFFANLKKVMEYIEQQGRSPTDGIVYTDLEKQFTLISLSRSFKIIKTTVERQASDRMKALKIGEGSEELSDESEGGSSGGKSSEGSDRESTPRCSYEMCIEDLDYIRHFQLEMILFDLPRAAGVPLCDIVPHHVVGRETAGKIVSVPVNCEDDHFVLALYKSSIILSRWP